MRILCLLSTTIALIAAGPILGGCNTDDPSSTALGATFVPAPIRLIQEAGKSKEEKEREAAECREAPGAGTYAATYIPVMGHLIRYDHERKAAEDNQKCRERNGSSKSWVNPDTKSPTNEQ
ncbi:MAG: hypothetical protein ACTHLO_03920 [Pseudolabrys sp.]